MLVRSAGLRFRVIENALEILQKFESVVDFFVKFSLDYFFIVILVII